MDRPSLRIALPAPVRHVAPTPAAPTAPDRVPERPAPARPFADMLRQRRAEATPPARPSAAPAGAESAAPAPAEAADATSERPAGAARSKARSTSPAKSPAAADQRVRDGGAATETRANEERAVDRASERNVDSASERSAARPAAAVDAATVRPLPVADDEAALAAGAADAAGNDGDEAAAIGLSADGGSAPQRSRRHGAGAGEARPARHDDVGRLAAAEPGGGPAGAGALGPATPARDAAPARPASDSAPAAAAIATTSAPRTAGEPMRAEPSAATVALPTPVDSPGFAGALGLQVSVLVQGGVQKAELHLNPAEMGPVSIRIELDGSDAQVQFGADLAATRQAIENGLPELASALRDAGFTLSGGGVSQHAGQRGGDDDKPAAAAAAGAGSDAAAAGGEAARLIGRVAAGGVDVYA